MLAAIAIALAVGIATYALWRVPTWLGVAHALAGLIVYAVVGYGWFITLFIAPRLFESIILPMKRVNLGGAAALILYYAPPFLAALLTVRALGRRRGHSDRMSR